MESPAHAAAVASREQRDGVTAGAPQSEPVTPESVQARLQRARAALQGFSAADPRQGQRRLEDAAGGVRGWDVPPCLAACLPGGWPRGTVSVCSGATSMLLSVVQALSRAGAWIAVVARPDLGLLAAQQRGVALERLVLIPEVGRHAAAVIAALIDGVDVVVTGHGVVLTGAQRRAVQARLRERDGLLLSESPWHGAAVTVTAERPRWHGLNSGDGLLRTVELDITVSGRRVPRTVHIAGVDPWAPVRAAGELPQRDPRNSPVPAAAMAAGSDGVMQELMVG